jgi:dTDP-4-amino-4,6-dideoxygalactose transaminase
MIKVNLVSLYNIVIGEGWAQTPNLSHKVLASVDGIEYDFKFLYPLLGYNFKSTEMNAAFGLEQLKKLPFVSVYRWRF